jgi:urease accessory protein
MRKVGNAAKWLFAMAAPICFLPNAASAHMAWAGAGGFWSGFLHPLTSLDEVCFLVALSIWATFNEPHARLGTLGVIAAVPTVAAVFLLWSGREISTLPWMAALMIVAGLGGALRFKVQGIILVTFAAMGAGLIGAETGQAVGGLSPGEFIIGAWLSPIMLTVFLLDGVGHLRAEWQIIACRAVASWIAAIGIMMSAFELWQRHIPTQSH